MDDELLSSKEFTPGFQHDIADLLEMCMEHQTDSITIDMEYPKGILKVEMNFKVIPKRSQEDAE